MQKVSARAASLCIMWLTCWSASRRFCRLNVHTKKCKRKLRTQKLLGSTRVREINWVRTLTPTFYMECMKPGLDDWVSHPPATHRLHNVDTSSTQGPMQSCEWLRTSRESSWWNWMNMFSGWVLIQYNVNQICACNFQENEFEWRALSFNLLIILYLICILIFVWDTQLLLMLCCIVEIGLNMLFNQNI